MTAGPLFVLSAAVVLISMLAPVLLGSRKSFAYAVLYDGLFEAATGPEGQGEPDDGEATGEEVRVIALELRNSSGLNIERPHYDRPVSVGFGEGARVVSAEVIEEHPPNIGATLRGLPERDPERVELEPVLLNDGDLVLLEVVATNVAHGGVEVDGRIVGIKRVVEHKGSAAEKTALALANGVVAVLAVVLGGMYVVFSPLIDVDLFDPSVLSPAAGVLAGLAAGDCLLLVALYRTSRRAARVKRHILARYLGAGDRAG